MTKGVVGTMSTMGFVTEPQLKAAKKIDYWLEAKKNQSIIISEVESYSFIRESAQGTMITKDEFCERIQTSLKNIMLECFENVDIEVRHEDYSPGGSVFKVFISATVYENGLGYDLAKSVLFNNKSYERIEE